MNKRAFLVSCVGFLGAIVGIRKKALPLSMRADPGANKDSGPCDQINRFPHRIHLSPGYYELYDLPDGRQSIVLAEDSYHEELPGWGPGGLPFGCWIPCKVLEHNEWEAIPQQNIAYVSEVHLWSESAEVLKTFAKRLKLRRNWKHASYYDVTEDQRKQALRAGAVSINDRELVRLAKKFW